MVKKIYYSPASQPGDYQLWFVASRTLGYRQSLRFCTEFDFDENRGQIAHYFAQQGDFELYEFDFTPTDPDNRLVAYTMTEYRHFCEQHQTPLSGNYRQILSIFYQLNRQKVKIPIFTDLEGYPCLGVVQLGSDRFDHLLTEFDLPHGCLDDCVIIQDRRDCQLVASKASLLHHHQAFVTYNESDLGELSGQMNQQLYTWAMIALSAVRHQERS